MLKIYALAVGLALLATPAFADPCEAPVKGYKVGQTISAPIRYVGDADSLCIGPSSDPASWVEIRIADFYGPELNAPGGRAAKAQLERITRGQTLSCVVGGDRGRTYSYDRVLATCYVAAQSVGDLMRAAGVAEGGSGSPARPRGGGTHGGPSN